MTDGPEGEANRYGDDVPTFPSEISTFEAAIRRRISGNWSLASDVWELTSDTTTRVTFQHRDSISRILLSTDPPWVDAEVRVEVYRPLSLEEARLEPDESINDMTVTDKTFDLLGEAVWFAEYFARTADDRIPEDPATALYGPPDGSAPEEDA